MMKLLMAMNYRRENVGAVAVYNTETQLFDAFYKHKFEKEYPLCGFRGMCVAGDRIIVCTSIELLVFKWDTEGNSLLVLDKRIQRTEWVVGAKSSGSLLDVFYSESRGTLFVSYCSMDAVDELDLNGNLIERTYLWDFLPDEYSLESYDINSTTGFFYLNRIFEHNEKIYVVFSNILKSGKGQIVNLTDRCVVLDGLDMPQGVVYRNNELFVNNSIGCNVSKYSLDKDGNLTLTSDIYRPRSCYSLWTEGFEFLDALYIEEKTERLLTYSSHWKPLSVSQSTGKVYEFDLKTRRQLGEYLIPEYSGLSVPYVRTLMSVDEDISNHLDSLPLENRFVNIDLDVACQCRPNPFFRILERERLRDIEREKKKEQQKERQREQERLRQIEIRKEKQFEKKRLRQGSQILNSDKEIESKIANFNHDQVERHPVITASDVVLRYRKQRHRSKDGAKFFTALNGVSFTICKNDIVGLIGRNGSGKSTLGKLIAGVLKPDSGTLHVDGRVSLLTLGTGFKQELTGRDNIYINASMLGYTKKQIRDVIESIIEFTEIGDFIDEPIKTYSSGMKSRLGFAIAAYMEPEILVIDEVLSTGDNYFRSKAKRKIKEMMEMAKCVIIVSHQLDFVKNVCTKCLWVEQGLPIMFDDSKTVVKEYSKYGNDPRRWCRNHIGNDTVKKLYEKLNA